MKVRAPAELNADAAAQLAASALAGPPGAAILIDLTAVDSLSLESAAVLMTLTRRCHAESRPLAITTSAPVHRKLTLLGLDNVLPLQPPA
ncbi:STAS domain-containing protein [Amycolatopsis plumensis]|uniref:STAS domain-containing protein n=2 Tax=Amycolatopsis plumensis TaxID=236508 RepID=A0ABV5U4B8_9PSEU